MAEIDDRPNEHDHTHLTAPAPGTCPTGADARKPYEPPRLLKKRSLARATLFTAHGSAMTGLTMMG